VWGWFIIFVVSQTTTTTTMIENIIKKLMKGKTFTCQGYGLTITYKVNVNVKIDSRHWKGEYKYIDLNIKVIECVRSGYGRNITLFKNGRGNRSDYRDVQDIVRQDMNKWVSPIFSTHFYRNYYTVLTHLTEIRINRYTYS
jgi:hypothetical protein